MEMVKRMQNCLHGYKQLKSGTEMTFIDLNPNEFMNILIIYIKKKQKTNKQKKQT
jgi:cytochrome c2